MKSSYPIALLFVSTLLCTCGSAPGTTPPTQVTGTLRYREGDRLLQSTLRVSAELTPAAPRLLQQEMRPLPGAGKGYYRIQRTGGYPKQLSFVLPCGERACAVDYCLHPVYVDSLPTSIDRRNRLRMPFSERPLTERESLVLFLEPRGAGPPGKLSLLGPSKTGVTIVPPEAFEDIPAGDYDAYFIKQYLARDTLEGLVSSVQLEYVTRSRELRLIN